MLNGFSECGVYMNITIETIIGFLSGTVVTIFLKGVIEYLQKRIEFKRGIEGTIHAKKLDAAEYAIKAMFQSYQSMLIIVTAIDNLLNKDMDNELFHGIWEIYFKQIEQGETSLLTSSVSLYFNLEDEKLWSVDDQKALFETYSNIKILGEEIQAHQVEIVEIEDEMQQIEFEDYIEKELREPLKIELRELGELLKKNSQAVFSSIQKIKSEFQK